MCIVSSLSFGAKGSFDADWKAVDDAVSKRKPRSAVEVLAKIEQQALERKIWPDYAAAVLERARLEYGFTEESALKKEGAEGLVAKFTDKVEASPVEVRPMLRLAVVHNYLSLSRASRYWKSGRTQIEGEASTNQAPWSAERLRPSLGKLFDDVLADAPSLQAAQPADWNRLLSGGNSFGDQLLPTLYDFALRDFQALLGENDLHERDAQGNPVGLSRRVLEAYDACRAFHAKDADAGAGAYAEFLQIEFREDAREAPEKDKRNARDKAFADFAEAYFAKTWVSALAAARVGNLRREREETDLVALHAYFKRFADRWPKTPGGEQCRVGAATLEMPEIGFETEQNWCRPLPDIEISYKNLTKAHFMLVKLDIDDLADHSDLDLRPSTYEDYVKKYAKRKPVKTWSADLPPKSDYRTHTFKVKPPADLPKGHYALFAGSHPNFGADKEPSFLSFVTVTDLALLTHCEDGRIAGFVLDAEKGTPVADARIELWTADRRKYKVAAKTKTDAAGAFALDRERDYGYLRAMKDDDEVLSQSVSAGVKRSDAEPEHEHLSLVTDRAIYRPGQTVKFKGYAFFCDPEANDYRVVADRRVFVTFRDPNGKEISRLALITNGYGTFSGEFVAPRGLLTGAYSLQGDLRSNGAGLRRAVAHQYVSVEEYKRPKFSVKIHPFKETRLGADTEVAGVATTFAGLPVANAEVTWTVQRSTCYASWWRCPTPDDDEPLCAHGTAKTDEKGEFRFTFIPKPPRTADLEGDPSFSFEVTAVATDDAGEAHSASRSFEVGVVPWRASVWMKPAEGTAWITPTRPGSLRAALGELNGEPVAGVKGQIKVYALKAPDQVVRKPLQHRYWDYRTWLQRRADDVQGGVEPWDPTTWAKGEVLATYDVRTDEKGQAALKGVPRAPGVYRAEFEVTAPNGKPVKSHTTWRVFEPAAKDHAVREPVWAQLESTFVPVGGTARLYWGTGYPSAYCRLRTRVGNKVVAELVKTDRAFCYELPITEQMVGTVTIDVLFLRENRLECSRTALNVPRPNANLTITREHFSSRLNPGAEETWRFTVSGAETNDVRAGVEMLAFLYDKSLDAFRWHGANLPFASYFGHPSGRYINWTLGNRYADFGRWEGRWDPPIPREGLSFRSWRAAKLGVFEAITRGWRPQPVMGMARGLRFLSADRAAPIAAAAEPQEDDAVAVMMEAAVPAAAKAAAPMALRKEAVALGAVAQNDAKPKAEAAAPEPDVAPRKNLAETAFFLPHLTSDAAGSVSFTFTVPEALTGWKFTALAHDALLRGGSLRDETIVTTKPLMVEPVAPRFAREGDRFLFPVKVSNTEETPQEGTVSLTFADAESGQSVALAAGGAEIAPQAFTLGPKETKTVEFAVEIPDGCGFLRYVAKAKGAAFADGEEGCLPVLSKRVEVREALPMQIKKAGVKNATFKELAASGGSDTLRHAGLAVQVVSDPTWYAFLALPYLMEYPHECCEQTFSRFYANALGAQIANARPAYRTVFEAWEKMDAAALKSPLERDEDLKQIALDATPWVREAANETKAKRHIGELFGSARLDAEQKRAVEKLEQNFNRGDDLWPWFPGGPGSCWVTLHILAGYARLDRLVADPSRVQKPNCLKRAREGLDAWMVKDIDKRLAWCKQHKTEFMMSGLDLRWMYLQSFTGGKSKHTPLLMKCLKEHWTELGISGQSLGAIVLARADDKALAGEIVASLKERAVRSEEFGLYWKRAEFFDCSLFAAPVSDQSLAMEAFVEVAPEDRAAYEDARQWLLEQKRTQNWSTTVSTVDAVYAILLGDAQGRDGKGAVDAQEDIVTVTLGGAEVPREGVEAGTGFYEYRYDAKAISAKLGEVKLARNEDKLGWVSLNWTYLEDVTKVKAFEQTGLRLTKTYFKKTVVNDKVRLVALGGGEPLRPGDELVSRLTIDSDRIYEYAHLSDERPASAEPVDVLSRYRWQDGLGYYQSTRDTATHYYFDRLPKGNFVLETSYRVRQQGVFTSGLASLQCMYAPEFGAHSGASTIEVKR